MLTLLLSATLGAALFAPSATVAPPPAPGPWHQDGLAVTSRPGKTLHLLRTVSSNPQALAVVVRSSAARPVRILWWSYCAINDDDAMDETHQQTARGVGAVITYPPVLSGATFCYVSVVVTPPPRARAVAAVFSY